jgi:hypothetical protein
MVIETNESAASSGRQKIVTDPMPWRSDEILF